MNGAKTVLGVGINTLDYCIQVSGFPDENSKMGNYSSLTVQGGGPVPNALVALSRLGFETIYVGNTSSDIHGSMIRSELKKEGVDISSFYQTAGIANLSFIVANAENASRTVIWRKTCASEKMFLTEDCLSKVDISDIIVVDGLETCMDLIRHAKSRNKLVIYGGESTREAKSIFAYTDILVASREFVHDFSGETEPFKILAELSKYGMGAVVFTDGEQGAFGMSTLAKELVFVPAFRVSAKDTTGAGDAFLAGMIYGASYSYDLKDSMTVAAAVAALNCLDYGGRKGLPGQKQLIDFFEDNHITLARRLK